MPSVNGRKTEPSRVDNEISNFRSQQIQGMSDRLWYIQEHSILPNH